MVIEMKNVSKTIRGTPIIRDISLELHSGVVTGLKGINGSGKTMIMRLLCGLIRPTKGEITIDGKVLGRDISFPESIGVLIENPAFLDSYSGFQNLKLLAGIRSRVTDDALNEILEQVGLSSAGKKKYKHYSLGMKQRLGIAAAVMEKPDIVLLDEPTNALDSSGIQTVKDILHAEKERGALVVLSCHDYSILKELSDEIYFIEEGALTGHEKLL